MTALPDWMQPPRAEGWFAEDLDRIPEAPRHTELIDGAPVFQRSPQRVWHSRLVTALTTALTAQAPNGTEIDREIGIRLDARNRPEPDVLAVTAPYDPDRTFHRPADVELVVEVVSPESAHRDRVVKLRKYAEAGIVHYWRIEEEYGLPVVHVHELDGPTGRYAPTGIVRNRLKVSLPFPVDLDLSALLPRR
ncbi:Uma2 family endonuclease [Streptacidiphilus griseoplanus]|uniref:Uma2 family endonuclease n=1 Tax=Peterkaempfera griseoplana TaxID=66896 RepID=UPI0006E35C14|nr:Uma2 family endonuclease [Peterkaempfera griseoplana]